MTHEPALPLSSLNTNWHVPVSCAHRDAISQYSYTQSLALAAYYLCWIPLSWPLMDRPSPQRSLSRDSPPDDPRTRLVPSRSTRSLQGPISRPDRGPTLHTSRTWTTSSGDHGIMSDTDEWEDRALFVQEYNRLATKVWSFFIRGYQHA